jgi:hypothetical protein
VLQCDAGSWWAIGAKPWQFWTAAYYAESLALNQQIANLSQNWCHWQSWNYMSCLQTIGYDQYGSDKWCCNVTLAPGGLLVPNHANFTGNEIGLLSGLLSDYYRITISLYISHGNWYGIAIGLLSSIYVTYVKIVLLSDYNSFFDLT